MNIDWTVAFLHQLDPDITVAQREAPSTHIWHIENRHWRCFAELAFDQQLRWVAGWAEDLVGQFMVNACFEKQGVYIVLRTVISDANPKLPSQATVYRAANRSERHTQDMFGIRFTDHPDNRRWTRHLAWSKHSYPLRKDFPLQGEPQAITPPDKDYPFIKAHGVGVYEIPV